MFFTPYGFSATRNPFRDLERLVEDLSSSFQRVTQTSPRPADVPLNVWSNDQGLVITAEVAGVDPTSVAVNVLGDTLTISGQRSRGDSSDLSFTRTVHLPYRVDPERTEARCADGVLTVALQRPEAERPRTIAVKAA
jgi:HSP20 family protein